MDTSIITAIAGFACVATLTPGPNNIMVMTSGANFGFRRTTPHVLGIVIGFLFMILLAGLGLVALFDRFPILSVLLKTLSVAYLLFLAWKIANATPPEDKPEAGHPLTFLQAAAFQWVNPKAWAMGLTAIALYAPDQSAASVMVIAVAFTAVGLPAISLWAVLGMSLRAFLSNRTRLRAFNYAMAFLLVASLYPALNV